MARILIVEDEFVLALTVEAIVQAEGHEVLGPVARVGDALRLIADEPVDAALLDIRLRHDEVVYAAADALAAKDVPFTFMTAYSQDSIDARYRARGTLRKPFSGADVARALRQMLPVGA
jgi:CheY-like chemotaxis protein